VQVTALIKLQLRNFSDAARQFGSTISILTAAFRLRERLAKLLHLFDKHAPLLFPTMESHESSIAEISDLLPDLPDVLKNLADAIQEFLKYMQAFPEFKAQQVYEDLKTFVQLLEVGRFTQSGIQLVICVMQGCALDARDHVSVPITKLNG
jgi:hypothetical protein